MIGAVEMAGVPRDYAMSLVPEFVAYHTAGETQANGTKWGQMFVSWCTRAKRAACAT